MTGSRIDDVATGALGGLAGTVADPRQGTRQLATTLVRPAVYAVGLAFVAGYLLGRRRR
ncbi:hypothetical protein [Micromonospora sp. HM5-17]|uniref:hypothetical protein n=1 Tax=Micromonospora sp. HM5-17 TaxID=2487710 RepID=UPI001315744C|nr:hypothetical protein [Micromonospora sp. HM5-17]